MDTEPGANRRERVVDWLESHPDLPHLFARLAELVHVAGYAPEDLVVLPRAEVDRRETAAFTGGWAEAVADELPRIRREYEKRVADAYAQGQGDARGIRRPEQRTGLNPEGARVIPLPFTRLLEPPAAVVQAEERVRLERELFDQRTEHTYADEPEPRPEPGPAVVRGLESAPEAEPELSDVVGPEREAGPVPQAGPDAGPDAEPGLSSGTEPLVTAQESRARRSTQPVRKVVRGKGGRPIVPPITSVPAQVGPGQERRGGESGDPDARSRARGRRLSDRAKALERELGAERAREAPPEPAP
ncbi:hypothetical protein [Streptomyces sp. NPDC090025]|uniref:hypothetical protein n=1 Tax=Streptomyces sp. NPDC090025 TaxID=3365922 RepID=UPI003836F924